MDLCVETFTLGMFQVNNYLVWHPQSREAVLIDTGKDPQPVLAFIQAQQLDLRLLLYTHTHIDHVEGHHVIRQAYPNLPAWMHADDQFWVDALPMQADMFGMEVPPPPHITGWVTPGQWFNLAGFSLEARPCPGHTPGGISYYVPEGPYLFTGDTIFRGSIGRTDFPRGDLQTLLTSIQQQILTLPDETQIYSGHGLVTTVGREREKNPFLLEYLKA